MKKEYLLVDGYNIIFAWDELSSMAKDNLSAARDKLIDILSNYQGMRDNTIIVVFDAHRIKGGMRKMQTFHNIHVVYTKEAETADAYIESVTPKLTVEAGVRVATSDSLEQIIILGQGALRVSAKELKEEIDRAAHTLKTDYLEKKFEKTNPLYKNLDKETFEWFEKMRRR